MSRRPCLVLGLGWLVAVVGGCSDGGPVGTGISPSQVSGTVIAVSDAAGSPTALDIPVWVTIDEAPEVNAVTDATGSFQLSGSFSGALTLRFTAAGADATTIVDVPLGASVELDDIRLRPGLVEYSRPRLRRFAGQVAMVDCGLDGAETAHLLVDDRSVPGNQFLVRVSGDTALVRANGRDVPCAQIKLHDRVAIDGVLLPDRTVAAFAIVVAPHLGTHKQPFTEIGFRGTVTVVNCDAGLVVFVDDVTGSSQLRIGPAAVLLDDSLQPVGCGILSPGDRVQGKGITMARRPGVMTLVRMVVHAPGN